MVIAVDATGTSPEIVQQFSADPVNQNCSVVVDTSRLIGFKDDYRLVLICGAVDPATDPQDDARIAISSKFHITGGGIPIVAPLGAMKQVYESVQPPPGMAVQMQIWHEVVLIPKDVDPATIKRASDVLKMSGGRYLNEPVGGLSSTLVIQPRGAAPIIPITPSTPKPHAHPST